MQTQEKCDKGQYGGNWSECYLCHLKIDKKIKRKSVGERMQTTRHYLQDRTLVS